MIPNLGRTIGASADMLGWNKNYIFETFDSRQKLKKYEENCTDSS